MWIIFLFTTTHLNFLTCLVQKHLLKSSYFASSFNWENWVFLMVTNFMSFVSINFLFRQPEVDSEPWFSPSSPFSWPSAPASTTSGSWGSSAPYSSPSFSLDRSFRPRSCPAKTTWRGRRSPSPLRFDSDCVWMNIRMWKSI